MYGCMLHIEQPYLVRGGRGLLDFSPSASNLAELAESSSRAFLFPTGYSFTTLGHASFALLASLRQYLVYSSTTVCTCVPRRIFANQFGLHIHQADPYAWKTTSEPLARRQASSENLNDPISFFLNLWPRSNQIKAALQIVVILFPVSAIIRTDLICSIHAIHKMVIQINEIWNFKPFERLIPECLPSPFVLCRWSLSDPGYMLATVRDRGHEKDDMRVFPC